MINPEKKETAAIRLGQPSGSGLPVVASTMT
jgi:hypothetical protein